MLLCRCLVNNSTGEMSRTVTFLLCRPIYRNQLISYMNASTGQIVHPSDRGSWFMIRDLTIVRSNLHDLIFLEFVNLIAIAIIVK